MVSVSPSVDVHDLFGTMSGRNLGLQPAQISGLPLARWFVSPGATPANTPSAIVIFASQHAIFTAVLVTDGSGRLPAVPTLLAIANRQIERAGGPPAATPPRKATGPQEAAMVKLLPAAPSARFGQTETTTLSGTDELSPEVGIDTAVIRFLNDRSHTVVRAYATPTGLTAAVGITKYPYGIFAAAALH